MSQENVELTRQAFDAFNRRDLPAFLTFMDEGVASVSAITSMEGDYHGHDGIRRWWTDLLDALPDYRAEVISIRDLGEVTITAARAQAHGTTSEALIEQRRHFVAKWADGKVVSWISCQTEREALEAAGLSE